MKKKKEETGKSEKVIPMKLPVEESLTEEESLQQSYYSKIEEEEANTPSLKDEIEIEDDEVFTLDFEKGIAYVKDDEAKTFMSPAPSYKNDMMDIFINTLTAKAVGSLLAKHKKLEDDIFDNLSKTHDKMGDVYYVHEEAMLDSIDKKKSELKKAFGFNGVIHADKIPDWAKGYVEEYIKKFVSSMITLIEDVE